MTRKTVKKSATASKRSKALEPSKTEHRPWALALDLIDEDPNQPRRDDSPGFSNASLRELAATIEARGVKTPISVREHPQTPGRFMINHGARRFRASKLAKKNTIPVFVDNDYNEADQVIENLQRNELTAREIADFIGRELAKGEPKGAIARMIGKSAAFVTQHVTLLDLPPPIADAFSAGRVRDVTVVNELVTAYRKNRAEVEDWLADEDQEITRGSVRLFRDFLEDKRQHAIDSVVDDAASLAYAAPSTAIGDSLGVAEPRPAKPTPPEPNRLKSVLVLVEHDGRQARLVLNRRPSADGHAWVVYSDDGREVDVSLSDVRLISLIEGD